MELTLNNSIQAKKKQILSKWQSLAMSSYKNRGLVNGMNKAGRFTDPVAYVTADNTDKIFNWLINTENSEKLRAPLEDICRLRAVQDIDPTSALDFIPALKQLIREELADEIKHGEYADELADLDQRIDNITVLADDAYANCKASINAIRINEMKRLNGRDAG